ncbi:MAG: S-ribosylhomocysteine lyase [Clostridia bacterium]|nr:S-ribosylhomocysteine lyase [Clostridia bacterium]
MSQELKQLQSFQIDHTILSPGMYVSRVDGDVVTYDLRFIRPNTPPYLPNDVMHTIEHLFATFVRSSAYEKYIVYFGPMGCRTGFYFLTSKMTHEQVIALTKEALSFIADFEGTIPGTTAKECGNYLEHNLQGAKEAAQKMALVLDNWDESKLVYPK